MPTPFHRLVSRRYSFGALGREEGPRFLRFITYAAIGGVAVGVATLLLGLAIVRGFSREIEAKIVGFGAHVQVESMRYDPLAITDSMITTIAQWEPVVAINPVVSEVILLGSSMSNMDGATIWGTAEIPSYIRTSIVSGTGMLRNSDAGNPDVVVGRTLARRLSLQVGDNVTAFSVGGEVASPSRATRPRVKQLVVSGIYETFLADFDDTHAFVHIDVARDLVDYRAGEATRLDLRLADPNSAAAIAEAVDATFGFPVMARSIYQVYRGLFAWVRLQETIIPLVIGILVLVAAFNIVGTLLMIILDKTHEIGILTSMGAAASSMRKLFLLIGLNIGVAGTCCGSLIAFALAKAQQRFDLIPLPSEAYFMDTAPVALDPLDFLIVGAVAVGLCVLAALIPAQAASKISPLRIIRFQ